jgi:hypothetical protein
MVWLLPTNAVVGIPSTVSVLKEDLVPPHPPVIVYVISVVPAPTVVTTPLEFTVATAVFVLLHAPVPPPKVTPATL